jgi:sphingolipid 4-desaturase/C4-monooxygenase
MTALEHDDNIHRLRQRAILNQYPSVKKLYGYDRRTQYYAYAIILLQLSLVYSCRNSWRLALLLGFTIGPYVDAGALCLIHEASHMLVFACPCYNRVLGILTNMIMIMPLSEIFMQHHNAHHKNLGNDEFDVDVPTDFEIDLIGNSTIGKAFWLTFNMIILPVRSVMRLPVKVNRFLILNWVVCLSFGALILFCSRQSFVYLLLSLLQSQGLHPANSRQVQRHIFNGDEAMRVANPNRPPTYSYYGRGNKLTLNVGLHVEHHDFPYIAWTRLPELRSIAGEQWYPTASSHPHRGFSEIINFIINRNISLADFAQ